jgi:hypothetical protein
MNSTWALYYSFVSLKSIFSGTPLPWSYQDKYFFPTREVTGSLVEFLQIADKEVAGNVTESPLSVRDSVQFWPTTPDYFQ